MDFIGSLRTLGIVLSLTLGESAMAGQVIQGTNGTAGVEGSTLPSGDGGNGSDGQTITVNGAYVPNGGAASLAVTGGTGGAGGTGKAYPVTGKAGDGGDSGNGGSATAILTYDGTDNFSVTSTGGVGGSAGYAGAVRPSNPIGGTGGNGGSGGSAVASAKTTNSTNVSVRAIGGNGGWGGYSSEIHGSYPYGTAGLPGYGGLAGTAEASLDMSLNSSAEAVATVYAEGGRGGFYSYGQVADYPVRNGGSATASAKVYNAAGNVNLTVTTKGGTSPQNATSGQAFLGEINAVSGAANGTVRVTAEAYGGNKLTPGFPTSGRGASEEIVNAVDGTASANIFLTQNAFGGLGGDDWLVSSYSGVPKTSGGNARSSLSRTKSATGELSISTKGIGGDCSATTLARTPNNGGNGESNSEAINLVGFASAHAESAGGAGQAIGGLGATAGNGGDALSTSRAESSKKGVAGTIDAFAESKAVGGKGGSPNTQILTPDGLGGEGGDASAIATALASKSNGGSRAVAEALGGNAGVNTSQYPKVSKAGGNATASASSTSVKNAVSTATATGGISTTGTLGSGAAYAAASSTGAHATATAQSGGGVVSSLKAIGDASGNGDLRVSARASLSSPVPSSSLGKESQVTIVALPNSTVLGGVTTGNAHALQAVGNGQAMAMGSISTGSASASMSSLSSVSFTLDTRNLPKGQNFDLSLVNPTSTNENFSKLIFSFFVDGVLVETESFSKLSAATAYFDDQIFSWNLDSAGSDGKIDFKLTLEAVTAKKPTSFGFDFVMSGMGVQPIPEPGVAGLVLFGAAVLWVRRRQILQGI